MKNALVATLVVVGCAIVGLGVILGGLEVAKAQPRYQLVQRRDDLVRLDTRTGKVMPCFFRHDLPGTVRVDCDSVWVDPSVADALERGKAAGQAR